MPEVSEDIKQSAESSLLNSTDLGVAKKRKVDAAVEFEQEVAKLNEWFDKVESALELLLQEEGSGDDSFTPEEQIVLVEVIMTNGKWNNWILLPHCEIHK